MKLSNHRHRPRPRRWKWQGIRELYRRQVLPPPTAALDERSQRLTLELNRLEDRTRHDGWRFSLLERPSGLLPGHRDSVTDRWGDVA